MIDYDISGSKNYFLSIINTTVYTKIAFFATPN